jgi:hypothetical protein
MGARIKGVFKGIAPKGTVIAGSRYRMVSSGERVGWLGNGGKPNPLAGFGRVGCGAFVGGQGAGAHRARTISGFAAECKQQKTSGIKVFGRRGKWGTFWLVLLGKKKKTDSAGKSAFF